MKKNIFLFGLLLISVAAFSQTAKESYDNGITLKNDQKYEEALAAFKKTISLDASYSYAYFQSAWCCNELEKYEDALTFLDKFNPDNDDDLASKYVEIGYANYKLENEDEAINAYNEALRYHPNYGVAYRGLGNVYYDNDEYEDAQTNFENAILYDEENSKSSYYTLGWLYNENEEYAKAESVLKKAIDYDPEDTRNYEELAYTFMKLGKYNDGITQAKKAIVLNPKSSLGYYYLGSCYMGLNQKDNAMDAYNKLKAFDEEEAETLLKEIEGTN
ncbi:MAG: tetratricopeptide repeat protein [Bacteroidetes bacterium]|nr:tetratricopeptide repeat protein [Bacteroidota bacterium]